MTFNGSTPIFIALANHYRHLIQQGVLKEGDALPSVREVALAEKVNPNTVVRAYTLLVEEGFVVSLPKKGYFVQKSAGKETPLIDMLRDILSAGYSSDDIKMALQDIQEGKA